MHRKRLTEAGALQARRRGQQGFTLIEAVLVIVLTGVLGGIVSLFIVRPVQAHLDTVTRADLVYRADSSLRRLERELRAALPNSVRVNAAGTALEYIPTTGAARYATESGNTLDFGSNDSSFDLVGPPLTVSASQQLVFYNLGNGITGSDAYAPNGTAAEQADSNRRMATNAAGQGRQRDAAGAAGARRGRALPRLRRQPARDLVLRLERRHPDALHRLRLPGQPNRAAWQRQQRPAGPWRDRLPVCLRQHRHRGPRGAADAAAHLEQRCPHHQHWRQWRRRQHRIGDALRGRACQQPAVSAMRVGVASP
jgi:type II secretory pathway pseudopilin PulG